MPEARIDGRPRILDFCAPIADARASRAIGWPCHAYRVAVPVRQARRLNIFDETVLRLLGEARLDERRLAETTCIEESLVRLVCCRLRDIGMLSEQNDVFPAGRAYLSETEEETLEYEVRWVFRDRRAGKLLPVVYGGALTYEELEGWDDTRGVATIRKGRGSHQLRLLRGTDGAGVRMPAPAEIVWAAKRHQELGYQFSVLRHGVPPCPPVVRTEQMNIDPDPEAVFLRCAAVIPASGDDYRISDPFGYGFSEILFRAYEALRCCDQEEQRFIQSLRSSASTVRQRPQDQKTGEEERAVLALLGQAVRDHRELFAALRQAEYRFRRSQRPPRSGDEETQLEYEAQQAAQHLAEALEAALAFVAARSRPAACEALLASGGRTPGQNGELLEQIARRLRLRTDGIGSLLSVTSGRVRGLRSGDVDLQALLAICLAAAAEDEAHPVRTLATSAPYWLGFVSGLKQMRDEGAHGHSRKEGATLLVRLRDQTYQTLRLLLPHLQPGTAEPALGPAQALTSVGAVHDARRQAITRLEERFGVHRYARLDNDAAGLLIQIERAATDWERRTGREPVDALRTVKDIASLLQALTFARAQAGFEQPPGTRRPREEAATRAREACLLPTGGELPARLAGVNPRRLDEALRGFSPSLGATLMSLLLLAPMESLRELAVASPNFLVVCNRVLELRGHGNRPVFLTTEDAIALKNDAYDACTALMEL